MHISTTDNHTHNPSRAPVRPSKKADRAPTYKNIRIKNIRRHTESINSRRRRDSKKLPKHVGPRAPKVRQVSQRETTEEDKNCKTKAPPIQGTLTARQHD